MGSSTVNFINHTGTTIYVAYMRRDFGCQEVCGDIWDVLGWVVLNNGDSQTRSNPTNNKWFYYYAESADGRIWSGVYSAEVQQPAFQKCTCQVGQGYHTVGFDVLDTDAFSGVTFNP